MDKVCGIDGYDEKNLLNKVCFKEKITFIFMGIVGEES
ncbi:hypothetical protein V757_00015 [Pelistega indica]|uniref:Uncharacterized protein n=1 Tax=Pelistega indica TaxID=1414851 RepID=V8GBK4_9BURK|nr:hypothetical protein V757_00015 [Pelistega indica]